MKLLRVALWPAALAAGGATSALVATGGIADSPGLTATLGLVVGLAWTVSGLREWSRRPAHRIGPLMVLFAFAWWASLLVYSSVSGLYTIGLVLRPLYIAVFGHLLLAFPGGRLEGRLSRAIVVAAYVDTTLVVAASSVFAVPGEAGVRNVVQIDANAGTAADIKNVARGVGVVLLLTGIGVLVRRWRHATPPWRRAAAPVLWSGAGVSVVAIAHLVNEGLEAPSVAVRLAFFAVLAAVPIALEIGLLRSRLARGAVAELVVELGQTRAPGKLRDALARALRDPSLSLAYWLPEQERYVDLEGLPVELPADGGPRTTTTVTREGRRVAALVHDTSLRADAELIDAVCAAAGLALENERLQAELRAHVEELRASRARIVEAADAERRRLERDLHDGAQQRLVALSIALGLAESRLGSDTESARALLQQSREEVAGALEDLRELSQGIHPGILTERGLGHAVQELAYRTPIPVELTVPLAERLPEPVEAAAYFFVAEALTNVVKYASASAAHVTVGRENGSAVVEIVDDGVGGADPTSGSGLRGLADRLEALGGTLVVESEPGRGTRLRAEIPCVS